MRVKLGHLFLISVLHLCVSCIMHERKVRVDLMENMSPMSERPVYSDLKNVPTSHVIKIWKVPHDCFYSIVFKSQLTAIKAEDIKEH